MLIKYNLEQIKFKLSVLITIALFNNERGDFLKNIRSGENPVNLKREKKIEKIMH